MKRYKSSITASAAIALAFVPVSPLLAETLPVAGIYAAEEDAPAEVQLLAIERFGGRAGERLAFAIEDRLRGATVDGEPWFDITFDTQGGEVIYIYDEDPGAERKTTVVERSGPDAILRGTASAEVSDTSSGTKEVKKCVERDDKKKCINEKIDRYECRNLQVSMRPELRLITRDGRRLYARSDYLTNSQRYCADESGTPSVDVMLQGLVDSFADRVRLDLAPIQRVGDHRVLESRKGIAKADRNAFKNAVKLTKNDPYGACIAFASLEATNPQDISVLFNIGLCKEGEGDLDAALGYYDRVLEIEPRQGNAQEGVARIMSRRRAEEQMAIHFGAPEEL